MYGYRAQRAKACRTAFENFSIDVSALSASRNPFVVLEVCGLAKEGYFSHEIAAIVGKSPKAVQKIFRRYRFPALHNICPPQREQRQDWKGGQKVVKNYLYVRTPDHPNRSKHGGYVAKHRLVMESALGRYLTRTEVVDHIDGDPRNNDLSNLRVFASNAEHLRETRKGQCPNWSEDGLQALDEARRKPRRTWKGAPRTPSHDPS